MSRPVQQPVSFKTVPGRNKTQKWQQAKNYNYDGDDWGALDEYDEYGGYDDPPAPPPAQQQRYASEPPVEQRRPNRQNSFDAGVESERRQFSGPAGFAQPDRRGSPAVSNNSSGSRPSQDYARGYAGMEQDRRRERNFTNPEQVPPPLNMRGAPVPAPAQGPSGDSHAFPPRKSSISSLKGTAPPTIPAAETMPTAKSPSTDKPLPFIRPSDIYKRIEEEKEKERASMDSSRPSMDSLQRVTSPPQGRSATDSPASAGLGRRPSMEPVTEEREPPSIPLPALPSVEEQRASREVAAEESPEVEGRELQMPEYRPLSSLGPSGFGEPLDEVKKISPVLPPVSRISGFGSEFLHGYTDSSSNTAEEQDQTPTSPPQHLQSTISRVMNAPVVNTDATRQTAFSSIQTTPTSTEHESDRSIDGLAANQTSASELQHHGSDASQGFRSVVNTAFDRKDDSSVPPTPISQDNPQAAGVGRSDTTSTANISPIMSRVPSAATAQQRQQERDAQVPPITEEPTPTQSRPTSAAFGAIPRKPNPGDHSRQGSGSSIVQPGYRRSLDPPSHGSSPSRTPGYETVESRRLSGPLAAVTVNEAEAPDVIDQAAEVPNAHLEPAETPASEISQPGDLVDTQKPLPVTGRGRSGTDYSMREADIAHNVNASPETPSYSPPIAQDVQNNQREFLRNHASSPSSPNTPGGFGRPVSPNIAAAGLGIGRSTTPGSMTGVRPDSPAKGRVREIAGNYNTLDEASRRNSNASVGSSKSSWSNFGRSEENLLRRKGTGLSQMESGEDEEAMQDGEEMFPQYGQSQDRGTPTLQAPSSTAGLSAPRPGVESQQSFRPHLPGEWVSYAPTPASEEPPRQDENDASADDLQPSALTPRASKVPDRPLDLTPTTKKSSLVVGDFSPTPSEEKPSTFNAVKDAGAALGASLMTAAGLTSQARDFGSTEPVVPVEQPEMQPKAPSGAISGYLKPQFARHESEATSVASSVANSVPPTPPAKDTPKLPAEGQAAAPVNKNITALDEVGTDARPISGYFSGAPLRTDRTREGSTEDSGSSQAERPPFNHNLSTNTAAEDFESDRLRKEIVRSLDPIRNDGVEQQDRLEDAERTQDALDAPDNARAVEHGTAPAPAAETQTKPPLLDQRFSWEQAPTLATTTQALQQPKPLPTMLAPGEIAPEAPYERPRSRGLHIMNADNSDKEDSPVEERKVAPVQQDLPIRNGLLSGVVSPMTESQENLGASVTSSLGGGGMQHLEPSPVVDNQDLETADSEGVRFPSYYQSDAARSTMIPISPRLPQTPKFEQQQEEITTSPQEEESTPSTTTAAAKRQSGSRIPPFREILSIKDTGDRIKTYNDTRQTFASMDTGLNSWLSNMLEKHPEHANLSTQSTFPAPAVGGRVGHRHSPSIMKMGSSDRKASLGGGAGGESPTAGLDMERMGQRGKDLMNKAGVLSGKAGKGMMAGGKGLFAKGKSRFGTLKGRDASGGSGGGVDKAALSSAPPSSSYTTPSTVAPPPSLSPSHQPSAATAFAPAAAPPASREESYFPSSPEEDTSYSAHPPIIASVPAGAAESPVRPLSPITYAAAATDSGSRTPASAASVAGGARIGHRHALSSAFERLRERSRSKNSSRSRKSLSRPQSLVLEPLGAGSEDESRLAGLSRAPTGMTSSALSGKMEPWNASDVAAGNGNRVRREAWEHPDAEIPAPPLPGRRFSGVQYAGFRDEEGAERLGVLPSPAAEEFGEWLGIGGGRAGVSRELSSEEKVLSSEVSNTGDGADGGQEVCSSTTAGDAVIISEQPLAVSKLRGGGSNMDGPDSSAHSPATTPRPPLHERKSSALSQLPSQQRARQLSSPMKPDALPLITPTGDDDDDDDDDELYNSTPIASKPASLPFMAKHAVEVEDDLYSSTPTAPKASAAPWQSESEGLKQDKPILVAKHDEEQQASAGADASMPPSYASSFVTGPADVSRDVSRAATGAVEADRRSEVSVEERAGEIEEKKGPEDFGPADSRRSSVSSLGSPDTVVGKRASMIVLQQQETAAKKRAPVDTVDAGAQSSAAGQPTIAQQIMQPPAQRPAKVNTTEQQRFMNRLYKGRVAGKPTERPMSFVPATADAPQDQDVLETVDEGTGTNVPLDVSALSGPPAGAPPYLPHPVFRNSVVNVQPTEYEKLRSSPVGIPSQATSAAHSRHASETSEKRKSRRFSGFFGRRQDETKETAPYTTLPTPSAVNENFAMGDVHGLEDLTPASEVPPALPEKDAKNAKRRSGIWDSLRPSPSVSKTNFSSLSSVGNAPSSKNTPPATSNDAFDTVAPLPSRSRGLLKKPPQRAASTATPTENKKQRFSGLGRIFGRSNTQGHNTPKPSKLTKMQQPQPPSREASLRRYGLGQNGGYAAHEARQRRQLIGLRQQNEDSPHTDLGFGQPPADLDERGIPVPPKIEQPAPEANVVTAPPQGWYAPGQDEEDLEEQTMSSMAKSATAGQDQGMQQLYSRDGVASAPMRPNSAGQQPTRGFDMSPPPQERPVQFRRLHSESFRRGLQQAQIPEAFQPVEASYGIQSKPIGPPSQHEPPVVYQPPTVRSPVHEQQPSQLSRQPTLPSRQPYWGSAPPPSGPGHSQVPWAEPRERQYSAVSAVSAASQPGPMVSGGPEYQHGEWRRGSEHGSISPMHSRQGSDGGVQPQLPQLQTQRSRMDSVDEEVARSPAKAYADQQTPYAISMPGGRSPPDSRVTSWSGSPPVTQPRVLSQDHVEPQYSDNNGYYAGQQTMPAQHDPHYHPGRMQQNHYPPMGMASPSYPPQQQYAITMPNNPAYAHPQMQDITNREGRQYFPPPYGTPAPTHHQQQQQQQYQAYPPHPQQQQYHSPAPPPPPQQWQDSYSQYQQRHQASYDLPPGRQEQRPWSPPHTRAPDARRPPPPHLRQKYYGSGGEGRPLTYQRTTSGYSGRRDDAAVGEQEIDAIMRGASYPGQEWAPRVYE